MNYCTLAVYLEYNAHPLLASILHHARVFSLEYTPTQNEEFEHAH